MANDSLLDGMLCSGRCAVGVLDRSLVGRRESRNCRMLVDWLGGFVDLGWMHRWMDGSMDGWMDGSMIGTWLFEPVARMVVTPSLLEDGTQKKD